MMPSDLDGVWRLREISQVLLSTIVIVKAFRLQCAEMLVALSGLRISNYKRCCRKPKKWAWDG